MSQWQMMRAMGLAVAQRIEPPKSAKPVNLTGKTVVVTGAGKGSLGYQVAKQVSLWGADVVISTRRETDATVSALQNEINSEDSPLAVNKGRIFGYPLDLGCTESVQEFAYDVNAFHKGRLDILINNAGIHLDLMSDWKQPKLTDDNHEIHWRVNYLGHFHLTQLLLPALSQAAAITGDARVVNVVSELHSLAKNKELEQGLKRYNSWRAYALSKLALVHHANAITTRFSRQGISGYALHPGAVSTNIAAMGLAERDVMRKVMDTFSRFEKLYMQTPESGAQGPLFCATDPDAVPGYYNRLEKVDPSADAQNSSVAYNLWEQTAHWTAGIETKRVIPPTNKNDDFVFA